MSKAQFSLEFILAFTFLITVMLFLFSSFYSAKEKLYLSINLLSMSAEAELCSASIDFFSTNVSGKAMLSFSYCKQSLLTEFEVQKDNILVKKKEHYLVTE